MSRKDGVTQRSLPLNLSVDNECVDVILAGIRIKVDYFAASKTFFVGVGMPGDGFGFSGQDGIPIGKLYDALLPLTMREED